MLKRGFGWLQILCWLPPLCSAKCLKKGAGISLYEGRRNASIDGSMGPLKLMALPWSSSRILTEIYRILVEEVLGYLPTVEEVASSAQGVAALVGCQNYITTDACSVGGATRHLAFEVWDSYVTSIWHHVEISHPELLPEKLGSPGYEGKEIMFANPAVFARAWSQAEVALEYFKSYSMSRVDASMYFTNGTALSPNDLLPCYETKELLDTRPTQNYYRWSQDVNGTDVIDGKVVARCFNSYWWVAPSCRHSLERCIPWITTNWWGAFETMAKAAEYGLPFMLASTTSAKQASIAANANVLTYSWVPNDGFVHAWDTRVVFPDYDRAEWLQGNMRTAGLGQDLSKLAWHSLTDFVPSAVSLARKLSVSLPAVQALLANLSLDQTSTVHSVACMWVADNWALWKSWIPLATDCFQGQGLANVTENGDAVFVESRSEATTCTWCMPGRYSEQHVDDKGATAICLQCQPGKSQMKPTQAQCLECAAGTYSDSAGAVSCKRCESGKWSSSTNSSTCMPCIYGTTRFLGSTSSAECVCRAGEYASMNGACLSCPDGMTCAFGSDVRLFPWLNASMESNGLGSPQLRPGYWSSMDDPLNIYKCENEGDGSCGGGLPGSCIGGRESVLCARCHPGYYVQISREGDDPVHCHQCWALAGCTIPLCVLAVWMIIVSTHSLANYYPLFVNATVDIVLFAGIGMIVLVLQICGIFRYTAVPWSKAGGLSSILDFAAPYAGTSSFFGIDCIIGQSSVGHYALLAAVPWLLFLSTVLFHFASHAISPYWRFPGWELDKTINTLGTIYNAIFITIANVAVSPASTYSHPNGENSLVRYPEVVYGSSMYYSHVVISITMVVFPILPHASACLWAVCGAPAVGQRNAGAFYTRFRFLLFPFRPTCWWWGILLMCQKLLLAFIPALPSSEPHLQISAIGLLSLMYAIGIVARRPWKPGILNVVDTFISIGFTIFGMLSTSFLDASENVGTIYGSFLIIILVVMLVVLFAAVFMATMHLLRHPHDGFSVPFEGALAGFRDYSPPVTLAGDFRVMCAALGGLSPESLQSLLKHMPISDWYTISECISVWHALAPEIFPRPALSQKRLVHILHSADFTNNTDRMPDVNRTRLEAGSMSTLFAAMSKIATSRNLSVDGLESSPGGSFTQFESDTMQEVYSVTSVHVQTDEHDHALAAAEPREAGIAETPTWTPRTHSGTALTPIGSPRSYTYTWRGVATPRIFDPQMRPASPCALPLSPIAPQNPLP